MTGKRKGRTGWHQATLNNALRSNKSNRFTKCVKALIVMLALWGWFPLGLADRINRRGGTRDD